MSLLFEVTDGRGSPTTNTAPANRANKRAQYHTRVGQMTLPLPLPRDTGVTLTKYGDLAAQGSK
jgi:hypothetical protein